MRVGIDDRAISSRRVVGALRNITSRQDGHRPKEMIRVLLINDAFELHLPRRTAMCTPQTDADAAHSALQQRPHPIHDLRLARGIVHSNHVALGNDSFQHHPVRFPPVQIFFVPA